MAFKDFQEAVIVLGRLRDELDRVLDDSDALVDEYIARWKAATDPATGDRMGVAGDQFPDHADAARPYFGVVDEIACLAGDVERRMAKASSDHWRSSAEVN